MFSPKDKSAKEGALKKLMALMDQGDHEELKSLKKPSAMAIDVTAMKPEDHEDPMEEAMESPEEEKAEDEPSDDEKAQITALYNRFCK